MVNIELFKKAVLNKENDDFEILRMFLMDFDFNSFETPEFVEVEDFLTIHRPRIGNLLQSILISAIGWLFAPGIVPDEEQ